MSPPNPQLQRTRSAPLRSPLNRKPFGGPYVLPRLLVTLGLMAALACKNSWENEVTTQGLRSLAPAQIKEVTLSRDPCETDARKIPNSDWPALLAQLKQLQPAMSIGERGPWETVAILRLKLPAGTTKIELGTRRSLPGTVVAIVDGGPIGPGLSFYEATSFASWVSASLAPAAEAAGAAKQPCK